MMEEKRMAQLDPRLERVADFVRPGALFADVGCDHGADAARRTARLCL